MALLDLPSVNTIVASTTPNSTQWFENFWPVVGFVVGVTVAVSLTLFIANVILKAIKFLTGHHDDHDDQNIFM